MQLVRDLQPLETPITSATPPIMEHTSYRVDATSFSGSHVSSIDASPVSAYNNTRPHGWHAHDALAVSPNPSARLTFWLLA